MIKIENFEVTGWEHAIRGMRNPMNSWDRMDSGYCGDTLECQKCIINRDDCGKCIEDHAFIIGPKDVKLMKKLSDAGSVHRKFMRMIVVYADITAPLYWWKEFDTYKVGTAANSCSTMHKIADKEFLFEDFSCEHLLGEEDVDYGRIVPKSVLESVIYCLNLYREKYLQAKTKPMKESGKRSDLVKKYWWQMIQLLPSSNNQRRTVILNYEVLANIYEYRRNHKLDEWVEFCKWIESLPYSQLITGKPIEV